MTKEQIKEGIEDYLTNTLGDCKEVWRTQIEECLFVGGMLQALKADLRKEGLHTIDRYGQKKVNPSLEYYNRLLPKYIAMLSELSLTPKQFAKLRESIEEDGESAEEWIENLTK